MGYSCKWFPIINEGAAPGSKPKLAGFIFNNRINFMRGAGKIWNRFSSRVFHDRISVHHIISKGFPIVTACSSINTEPNIADFIFINTNNLIIGKPIFGREILKGFPIVTIYTSADRAEPHVAFTIF